jgi:hypothetical protein
LKVHFNIISPSTSKSFERFFPSDFSTKTRTHLSSPPYVSQTPDVSFFPIWSLESYLVRSTHLESPHYVVFSTPLLPSPS